MNRISVTSSMLLALSLTANAAPAPAADEERGLESARSSLEAAAGRSSRQAMPLIGRTRDLDGARAEDSLATEFAAVYRANADGTLAQAGRDPVALRLEASGLELFVVRHGESEANRNGVLNGCGTDQPLTRTPNEKGLSGVSQAESAAASLYDALGGDSWALAVTSGESRPLVLRYSPLLRAKETAQVLERFFGARQSALGGAFAPALFESRSEAALTEISFGELDGKPLSSVAARPSWAGFDCYKGLGSDFGTRFPGATSSGAPGESRLDVIRRQRSLLDKLAADYAGRKVALISHFETIIAQSAILGLLPRGGDGTLRAKPVPNASPIRLAGP